MTAEKISYPVWIPVMKKRRMKKKIICFCWTKFIFVCWASDICVLANDICVINPFARF